MTGTVLMYVPGLLAPKESEMPSSGWMRRLTDVGTDSCRWQRRQTAPGACA